MLPDRVSNPGPLTYESGALPIALRGRASIKYNLQDTFSLFRKSIMLFQLVKSKFQDAFM